MTSPDQDWKSQAPSPKGVQPAGKRQQGNQSWGTWLSQKAEAAKKAVDDSGYVELAKEKAQAVKESVGPALTHAVSQLEVQPPSDRDDAIRTDVPAMN